MEFLFQFIFEFLVQVLLEGFADVLFGQTLQEGRSFHRFFFFLLVGAGLGALSLLVVRTHLIDHRPLRYASAVITPILIGFVMTRIGRLRVKRGGEPNSLEYFFSNWAFAFAFGAVRVVFAK